MECKRDKNMADCSCTYEPCSHKGKCCECIVFHRKDGELPGCLFPADVEQTYDRRVTRFVEVHRSRKG